MLVKSPLKNKKTKQNRRKSSSKKKNGQSKNRSSSTKNHGKRVKKENNKFSLPSIDPWKIILGAIVLGLLGMAYLNHVFATQELLAEVEKLEQQYNQTKRSHDNYQLQYDRMIGPAEISVKAKELGFINGGPAEKVIEVEPE